MVYFHCEKVKGSMRPFISCLKFVAVSNTWQSAIVFVKPSLHLWHLPYLKRSQSLNDVVVKKKSLNDVKLEETGASILLLDYQYLQDFILFIAHKKKDFILFSSKHNRSIGLNKTSLSMDTSLYYLAYQPQKSSTKQPIKSSLYFVHELMEKVERLPT